MTDLGRSVPQLTERHALPVPRWRWFKRWRVNREARRWFENARKG